MRELYDAVPETLAEKCFFYVGIIAVTIGCFITMIIAGGLL